MKGSSCELSLSPSTLGKGYIGNGHWQLSASKDGDAWPRVRNRGWDRLGVLPPSLRSSLHFGNFILYLLFAAL